MSAFNLSERSNEASKEDRHQLTKAEKIDQIGLQKCDIFVDDLPEILKAEKFPKGTRKILFDPCSHHLKEPNIERISHWDQLKTLLT